MENCSLLFDPLSYAYGEPQSRGLLKKSADDFCVDELLSFEPSGAGEHTWLRVWKKGLNSMDVVQRIAGHAQVKVRDVGYSGLKDKNAVTTQWFSVRLSADRIINWSLLENDSLKFLEITCSNRKLRRGTHKENQFKINIVDGHFSDELIERLELIKKKGVPNYFGSQRFGKDNANLKNARLHFDKKIKVQDRFKKGLYLSSVRSAIFNHILSIRIADNTWQQAISQEPLMLNGTHSVFVPDDIDHIIRQRLEEQDIHTTGALWGKSNEKNYSLIFENELLENCAWAKEYIESAGMKIERRSLRLIPKNFHWKFKGDNELSLSFTLPSGSYATSVIREIAQV